MFFHFIFLWCIYIVFHRYCSRPKFQSFVIVLDFGPKQTVCALLYIIALFDSVCLPLFCSVTLSLKWDRHLLAVLFWVIECTGLWRRSTSMPQNCDGAWEKAPNTPSCLYLSDIPEQSFPFKPCEVVVPSKVCPEKNDVSRSLYPFLSSARCSNVI